MSEHYTERWPYMAENTLPTQEQLAAWLKNQVGENIFADTDRAGIVIFENFMAEALLKYLKGND